MYDEEMNLDFLIVDCGLAIFSCLSGSWKTSTRNILRPEAWMPVLSKCHDKTLVPNIWTLTRIEILHYTISLET